MTEQSESGHVNRDILEHEGYKIHGEGKHFSVYFNDASYKKSWLFKDRLDSSAESVAKFLDAKFETVKAYFELDDPMQHKFVKVIPHKLTAGILSYQDDYHDIQSPYRFDQEMSVIHTRKDKDNLKTKNLPYSYEHLAAVHEAIGHGID